MCQRLTGNAADEMADAGEIGCGVHLEGIAMSSSKLDEGFGRDSCLEEQATVTDRYDLVTSGVEKQLRSSEVPDFPARGELAHRDPSDWDIRVELLAAVDHGCR